MKSLFSLLALSCVVWANPGLPVNPGGIGGLFKGPNSETIIKGPDGSVITAAAEGGEVLASNIEPIVVVDEVPTVENVPISAAPVAVNLDPVAVQAVAVPVVGDKEQSSDLIGASGRIVTQGQKSVVAGPASTTFKGADGTVLKGPPIIGEAALTAAIPVATSPIVTATNPPLIPEAGLAITPLGGGLPLRSTSIEIANVVQPTEVTESPITVTALPVDPSYRQLQIPSDNLAQLAANLQNQGGSVANLGTLGTISATPAPIWSNNNGGPVGRNTGRPFLDTSLQGEIGVVAPGLVSPGTALDTVQTRPIDLSQLQVVTSPVSGPPINIDGTAPVSRDSYQHPILTNRPSILAVGPGQIKATAATTPNLSVATASSAVPAVLTASASPNIASASVQSANGNSVTATSLPSISTTLSPVQIVGPIGLGLTVDDRINLGSAISGQVAIDDRQLGLQAAQQQITLSNIPTANVIPTDGIAAGNPGRLITPGLGSVGLQRVEVNEAVPNQLGVLVTDIQQVELQNRQLLNNNVQDPRWGNPLGLVPREQISSRGVGWVGPQVDARLDLSSISIPSPISQDGLGDGQWIRHSRDDGKTKKILPDKKI